MRHLKIFTNWRVMTIMSLDALSIALLAGETDCISELVIGKAAGLLFAYLAFMLSKAWEGKMPELDMFDEP